MHSTGGLSINHDITSHHSGSGLPHYPRKSTPNMHRHNSVRVDPYAHPQQIKVLKHFTHIIWVWNALHGGFKLQLWHWNITQAQVYPNLPKIHPQPVQADQCEGWPICPSTAYQCAKTLCIQIIWMWNALHRGLSFNHGIATSLRLRSTPISPKILRQPA